MKDEIRVYEREYGCLDVGISKSPTAYLRLKASESGKVIPRLYNGMDTRYGEKTTPTTRRTNYDHENRRYY